MDELVKALRHFIGRDLMLLIGGTVAVAAFLYRFDRFPISLERIAAVLLLTGISYVVGNALQAAFGFARIVSTEPLRKLPRLAWLYEQITREPWADVPETVDFDKVWSGLNDQDRARCERIITLKMLGTAVGPASLIAGVLVLWRFFVSRDDFDLWLALASMLISVILFVLGRVTAAQQASFYHKRTLTPPNPVPEGGGLRPPP